MANYQNAQKPTGMTEKKNNQLAEFMAGGMEVKLSPATVRSYLVSGDASKVTDQEIVMFINLCKYNGLNPWTKEAYLIKYGSSPATIVPGKEAFTRRAERHEQFDGFEAGVIILANNNIMKREGCAFYPELGESLLGGWACVHRKDRNYPIYAEVSLTEYNTNQSKWKSAPATMIRKVALVQALREAFPSDLGGMYSAEEQGVREPDTPEPIEAPFNEVPPEAAPAPMDADDPFAAGQG